MEPTADPSPSSATNMSCVASPVPQTGAQCQHTGLCTHCQVLQLRDIDPDQISVSRKYELKYERHDTLPGLPEMAQSAVSGCGVCRMLHGEIMDALDHLAEPGPVKICRLVVKFYEHQMVFEVESPCGQTRVTFYIAADSELRGADKLGIFQKHVPKDLLSEAGIANVHKFVNQALEWSPLSNEPPTLPTRLLDVGGRPEQEEPRLVVSSEHSHLLNAKQSRYIALSYCWGTQHGAPLLKTERATLPDFKKRIPLSLFPPALRDAILVTRRVGVQYIWIDALCIVQDDRGDWELEAARMASVYRNAYLTFCSTQGSCANGFAHRPSKTAEVAFSAHLAPLIQGSYHLTGWMDENFEWESRGWTFQELYFSPRAILFGKMQTYLWDTRSAGEADPEIHISGEAVFQPESRRQWWEAQVRGGSSWRLDEETKLHDNWYQKISLYSGRSLTFATDRLPAISALASHVGGKFVELGLPRETYVAGLWAGDLCAGLLWSISGFDADPAPSLAEYRAQMTDPTRCVAPSWSWACQGEYVAFHGYGEDFNALGCVEAVHVQPAGLDPYGQVKGGHVVLSGWMARVPYSYFECHQVPSTSPQYEAIGRTSKTGVNSLRLFSPNGGEADVAFDWWVEDERHAEYWPSGKFEVILIGMSVYPPELAPSGPEDNWELFKRVAGCEREVRRDDGSTVTYDSIFVLGLALYETEQPGVYLRAGYIRGSAFGDTLAELKDAEYRTIKIV